jgi:hypothetical protein
MVRTTINHALQGLGLRALEHLGRFDLSPPGPLPWQGRENRPSEKLLPP